MNRAALEVVAWTALACAVVLVPGIPATSRRLAALAGAGRIAAPRIRRPDIHRLLPLRRLILAGGAVLVVVVAVVGGPALAVAACAAVGAGWSVVRSALARRRRSRRRRDLLVAVRAMTAELEAGGRTADVLTTAAVLAPQHEEVFAAAAVASAGAGDVPACLLAAADDRVVALGHAWRVAASSGAPLVDVLSRLAADLAWESRHEQQVAAALSGPRSSAGLLAILPVVGIALGAAMGAKPLSFLLGDSRGRLVCCAGALLDAVGVLWTQRLMRSAERP